MTAFRKYHGLGNDFVLIDNRSSPSPILKPDDCIPILDRHTGVGGDGVIFLLPARKPENDMAMAIVNSDGSVPEMCGNGIRCLVRFAKDIGVVKQDTKSVLVETLAGVMKGEIVAEREHDMDVRVNMGQANVGEVKGMLEVWGKKWEWTEVGMGNPHCVVFVDGEEGETGNGMNIEELDVRLEEIGRLFECNERFPQRTNVHFVKMNKNRKEMRVVVWERGAGRTQACGTGACACAVAAALTGKADRNSDIKVVLPGGPLTIRWLDNNDVLMSGPGEFVFEGKLASKAPALAGSAA